MDYYIEIPPDPKYREIWLICCVCKALFKGANTSGCVAFSFCSEYCWNNAPLPIVNTVTTFD